MYIQYLFIAFITLPFHLKIQFLNLNNTFNNTIIMKKYVGYFLVLYG